MENFEDQRGKVPQDKDDSDGTYSPYSAHSISFEEQYAQSMEILYAKRERALSETEDFLRFASEINSNDHKAVDSQQPKKSCLEKTTKLNHNSDGENVYDRGNSTREWVNRSSRPFNETVKTIENNEDRPVESSDDDDVIIVCTPPPSPPSTVPKLNHNSDGNNVSDRGNSSREWVDKSSWPFYKTVTAIKNNKDRPVESSDDDDVIIVSTPPPSPPSTVPKLNHNSDGNNVYDRGNSSREWVDRSSWPFYKTVTAIKNNEDRPEESSDDDDVIIVSTPPPSPPSTVPNLNHNNKNNNVGVKKVVVVLESTSEESDE